jgi:hypothetical protein
VQDGKQADDEVEGDEDEGVENESDEDDSDAAFRDRDQHPLVERASQFMLRLDELFEDARDGSPEGEAQGAESKRAVSEATLHTLFQGAGDMCGGLAQAMSPAIEFVDDRGLRIVQLKRALRGAAFARGALYNIGSSSLPEGAFKSLKATLDSIEGEMFTELGQLRESL